MFSKLIKQYKFPITQYVVRSSATNLTKAEEKINFNSTTTAYGYKSTRELFRGWFVFKLCSFNSLVSHLSQVFSFSRAILGRRLFEYIIRSTIYQHFVAGIDKEELKPLVERLRQHGVKLILDYSMESDLATTKKDATESSVSSQANEEFYNENMLKSIENVQTAAELSGPLAITAVKITAFVSPDILQKLNQVLEQQQSQLQSVTKDSILQIVSNTTAMNNEEKTGVERLLQRIHRIVQEVQKNQGRIFIDAEQSYFQTAIHKLALELQEHYNRDRIIVYNTYQCYRKITLDLVRRDLALSKAHRFHIGFKLVRGAYMDQERKRAADLNTVDPIHPNFPATTECYHRVFTEILESAKKSDENRIHVFVASHNEQTVEFALKNMHAMNMKHDDGLVSFATLFGMCDYLTFPLAAVGYDAYKLTPYGPINRLLPYITRRAQENRAIFAKAEKDRRLYYQALKQRI